VTGDHGWGENDVMTEVDPAGFDPASVLEAVAKDMRLRAYVRDGEIAVMPAKQARRRLLLIEVARGFEPGVRYSETAVSSFLAALYPDYAALRRCLVDEGFLSRQDGEYWRTG
jgi:hypothetical protein